MLLVQEPKVLLIDEPVAGMSQTEMDAPRSSCAASPESEP